jgi:lipoprotein-anchoring transpeptidase ErfK/SrfK
MLFFPLAILAPLAGAQKLERPESVQIHHQPTVPKPPSAYERAARRGQPIAVLRRATVLRDAPAGRVRAKLGLKTEFGTERVLAATGERRGWLRVIAAELPNGRSGWIPAGAARIQVSPWAVRADLSARRVVVRENGRVVRRFRVGIGRAVTPTPTGRFAVTDKIQFIGGSSAYGWGVLALSGRQTHIEPDWRGGDRLAIHGTTETGTIGRAASFGCLRASDRDIRWIVKRVWLGSIVEIAP